MELIFNTTDGPLNVANDTLLVFIDETGHEKLADRRYPIFGLGGCVVRADEYLSAIHNPWTSMKSTCFPQVTGPLHATGLRPTPQQATGIADVFLNGRFGRIASVLSNRTAINTSHVRYQLTTGSLMKRLENVALTFWPFSSIIFVLESSERADRLAIKYFGPYDKLEGIGADDRPVVLPITKLFADKPAAVSGLEVADFIMHAAGKCVYGGGTGNGQARSRRDFQAVFASVPATLASFMEISAVNPSASPTESTG